MHDRIVTKLQVEVAPSIPFLVRQAANRAGFEFSSLWVRDRIARALADELGEDYDELMADMPVSWRQRPGAIKLKSGSQESKGSVSVGQDG